jgi:hypothetical protein
LIKLRIDVDYPYPSRLRSFIYTALNIKAHKDYLKNSKILAGLINESTEDVKAYWFFTPKTVPDKELLDALNEEKHEVALHIVNQPFAEQKLLENETGRKIHYYTVHGTSRLLGRIIWKRWKAKAPSIPQNFSVQSFHQFPTLSFDSCCYSKGTAKAVEAAEISISHGKILEIHPEWLFQRGTINHRGPYYGALRTLLNVDEVMKKLAVRKKFFVKIARDTREYEKDVWPTEKFAKKLKHTGVDIFTFIERIWVRTTPNPPKNWKKTDDNIAILRIHGYDEWWQSIGKKTRNMVRKAEKSGVATKVVEPDVKLAEGIWKIYNETPIRQGRSFPHYGVPLETVKRRVLSPGNRTFIGSYLGEELVGFIQLVQGDKIAILSQILSLQKQWDKAVNNALVAKAIEVCAAQHVDWLMYGRMGNHPSLDRFKQNNGFARLALKRYYVPLTLQGSVAIKLGLHREFRDALPQRMKYFLIPIYNWISRAKAKMR